MWQEVVVGIIGIITLLYVGWKIYVSLVYSTKNKNSCCGCKGCTLKNQKLIRKNFDK